MRSVIAWMEIDRVGRLHGMNCEDDVWVGGELKMEQFETQRDGSGPCDILVSTRVT